tara:strand:+ start:146 stop:1390 length:1245 start_codon:yes stop_codon:yes gene_type:complete
MINKIIDRFEIKRLKTLTKSEETYRKNCLDIFNRLGLPSKRDEDWKFSDVNEIFSKNFNKFNFESVKSKNQNVEFIKDLEHNYILVSNGEVVSSDFKYEDKDKINLTQFKNEDFSKKNENNSLIYLNHALSEKGYSLNINKDYKFKKVLVIYNYFSSELNENFLNIRNKIKLSKNSELHIINFIIVSSSKKFFSNTYEETVLEESAVLKNIYLQDNVNDGYFHKFARYKLLKRSNYSSHIFPSGPKFNKFDLEYDLLGDESECKIIAATFLDQNDHQEIKTKVNHLAPNCKSYQKVKKVVSGESKGVYQGKIYVKDIAQKTDAYQLSKAILLSENSEFDSKPELEIYADDVKCSHGSSSGSIDEESIYYLMSRGLNKIESTKLLVEGFLSESIDTIKSTAIKKFLQTKLTSQIK